MGKRKRSDVDVDPDAVEAAATRLRRSARTVESHGSTLDTATSGRRVGRGRLGSTVQNLVGRAMRAVTRGATRAVARLHDDTAEGLERVAARTRKRDADAGAQFDSLGNRRPAVGSGSPHASGSGTPHASGSGTPHASGSGGPAVPQVKPPHSPDTSKWQARGGKIEYHPDGSVTYTSGAGHSPVTAGTSVTYDKKGNPDFGAFLTHPSGIRDVKFDNGYLGNRGSDFTDANNLAYGAVKDKSTWETFGAKSPDGYTWHHYQDLKTMQLVERPIHQLFPHRGGVSMLKG